MPPSFMAWWLLCRVSWPVSACSCWALVVAVVVVVLLLLLLQLPLGLLRHLETLRTSTQLYLLEIPIALCP